jgi:hypothetical protein
MRADTAPVTLTGVVRKRRSLSRLLAFIDLETDDTSTVALVADGWFLLKTIVAGLRVRVTGVWETPCETRGARLALVTDGVTVLEDVRSENAWENASASAAWRARVRETGASADTTVNLMGPDSFAEVPTVAATYPTMCLSWSDFGRCPDPTCLRRHAASSRWETQRQKRAEARRAGTGGCLSGNAHARRTERNELEHENKNVNSEADGEHGAADAAKSKHNLVFAKWLVDTFGVAKLKGGSNDTIRGGVVDIAGGRGLLSFELALTHGVPATLIEPKPLPVLNKKLRKRIKKWRVWRGGSDKDGQVFQDSSDNAPHRFDAKSPDETNPVRVICASFLGMGDGDAEDANGENGEKNEKQKSTEKTELHIAIESAAVLVAMHPDQATDFFVTTALALKKPFAVVPCCVFVGLNEHRKLADGTTVATYDQMMDYYQSLHPEIQRERLPFRGRRDVLFKL